MNVLIISAYYSVFGGVSYPRKYCNIYGHGMQPRVHGNTKRLPKHTLTLESVEYVLRFLLNYFEQHGILLPGRVPGYAINIYIIIDHSLL